jgi:tetratricopeptide (TPR) repeat protein
VMALAMYYEKNSDEKSSVKLLESYQEKFGPSREVGKHLSRIYLEREDYKNALRQLTIVEDFDADNLNVKLQMALIMIELKKYEEAAIRLEDILVEAPESDRIRYYLGAVYEQLKEYKEAVIHFARVPSSSTYFAESVILSANIHRELGDQEKAAEVVESAISFRDDIPQFYAFYAALLDELKRYRKAIRLLKSAVSKFPSHTQILFFLGSMHDRVGETDKTIEHLKRVIEIDENHVQALNYLAFTYAEKNMNLADAEVLARKALSAKPNDGYILDTMGWVFFKKGEISKAVKYLEAAYKNANDESVIAEHLADAYSRLQLIDKAVNLYKEALRLEKDERKASAILQKISAIQSQDVDAGRLPASSEKPRGLQAPRR